MELNIIQRVYFVGIGGIGMSALARYFLNRGCLVCGYDKTKTSLTEALESEGMVISYSDDLSTLSQEFLINESGTLIIYTPAIPVNSVLLNHFQKSTFVLKKRSEVLGIISKGQFCIAVAGTHGKTTTTSIIAHILKDSGYGCTAFLGGIASNYNSNFLLSDNNVVVVEADEYDRSFLTLHPDLSVVTSMDADHLDIYGDASHLEESFKMFAGQLKPGGSLFVKQGLPLEDGITYSVGEESVIKAVNIRVEDSCFLFDYVSEEIKIEGMRLMLPGNHNVENAVAAISVALKLDIAVDKIYSAVASFRGVKRRFEYIVKEQSHVYIDDYAHHPEELKACFAAVKHLYPDKKLTVVFQPHLFTRTRDFVDGFAEVLGTVDELLLLDIYPAREMPIDGIDSAFLLAKIELANKSIYNKAAVLDYVKSRRPELLVTVGAGDIDTLIQPIKEILTNA